MFGLLLLLELVPILAGSWKSRKRSHSCKKYRKRRHYDSYSNSCSDMDMSSIDFSDIFSCSDSRDSDSCRWRSSDSRSDSCYSDSCDDERVRSTRYIGVSWRHRVDDGLKCCEYLEKMPSLLHCYSNPHCPKEDGDCKTDLTPFVMFSSLISFFEIIPIQDARRIMLERDNNKLKEAVEGITSFDNYDSFITYFWCCDACIGIGDPRTFDPSHPTEFSDEYVAWFLTRFLYFLDKLFINAPVNNGLYLDGEGRYIELSTKKVVNFLELDESYEGCICPSRDACVAFNMIIRDTRVLGYLVHFILCLSNQLKSHKGDIERNDGTYTTAAQYADLLKFSLRRTYDIAVHNQVKKEEYVANDLLFSFVSLSISTAGPPAGATPPAVVMGNAGPRSYLNLALKGNTVVQNMFAAYVQ